jgi:hypothetical protein
MGKPAAAADDERTRRGRRSRRGHAAVAVLLTLLLTVACTSNNPTGPADPTDEPDQTETTDEATPEPTEPETETETEVAAEVQIGEVWEAFHTAWTDQAPTEAPDPAAFDAVAVDPDATAGQLTVQRGEARTVTTAAELWPTITLDGPEAATISDCAIVTQHPDGQPDSAATITVAWEATATATADGWRIDTAQPTGLFCIAEELNDQLLDAYERWLEAHQEWSDPPDPQHPLLAQTMAEPGLADMRSFLTDELAEGVVSRFPHDPNGAVTDIGIATARVSDCYEAQDDYGVFDLETGERRSDLVPAPDPGQRNRTIADLERGADGDWKVVGWRWEERNDCEPGETRYGVR